MALFLLSKNLALILRCVLFVFDLRFEKNHDYIMKQRTFDQHLVLKSSFFFFSPPSTQFFAL
jgi:hypothetical protein